MPYHIAFNYTAPVSAAEPPPGQLLELMMALIDSGGVLDAQALLALRLLYQHQWLNNADTEAGASAQYWAPLFDELPYPSTVCFFSKVTNIGSCMCAFQQ